MQNVAQCPLHHVTYSATKFEVAATNGLGAATFTRNVTDRGPDGQTTDDFDMKFIYHFFLRKKKPGIIIFNYAVLCV